MKYLYAYECEKKALSSPAELQAAIDGNRREGRRPSYSSSLFGYSSAAGTAATGAPALLSPPKIRFPILGLGSSSGTSASSPRISPAAALRKGLQGPCGRRKEGSQVPVFRTLVGAWLWVGPSLVPLPGEGVPVTTVPVPNRLAMPVTLAGQQASTRTTTLEQLRERLESGEPPEKKASRLSEEEQRLAQQAFQRNFFSMARPLPMKIRVNGRGERRARGSSSLPNACRTTRHSRAHRLAHGPWDRARAPPALPSRPLEVSGGQNATWGFCGQRPHFTKLRSFARGPAIASGTALFSSKEKKQLFTGKEPETFTDSCCVSFPHQPFDPSKLKGSAFSPVSHRM